MTSAPGRPYGFWKSTLWVLAAAIASAAVALVIVFMYPAVTGNPKASPPDEYLAVVTCLTMIAVLAWAAKRTGWPVTDYFALVAPPKHYLAIAVAGGIAVSFVATGIVWLLDDGDVNAKAASEAFQAAQKAGLIPLYWLTTVILAPLAEEVTFRGFLLPSWASSRLRSIGAIIATSALFAAVHIQYDWRGAAAIGVIGVFYGWLRWRSGSLVPSIVAHVTGNALVTVAMTFE